MMLVTGGVAAFTAQPAAAAAPIEARGAGIGAPGFYRLQDTVSDTETADAETEAAAAEDATENEAAEAPGDEAVDGIDCVQQGEHEGENEDC